MNISKLALIALLGSALMAFGCSDDEPPAGPGGSGGSGGAAGSGGSGGVPAADPGVYGFSCPLESLGGLPLPVTITINADDPGFVQGVEADLTTSLNYGVAPNIIALLPDFAPDAVLETVDTTVSVTGGTGGPIEHSDAYGIPPVPEFDSAEVVTAVTPDADATEIALAVTAMAALISGVGTDIGNEDGEIILAAGQGDCTDVMALPGGGPLTIAVSGAGGSGGSGGGGGGGSGGGGSGGGGGG